MGHVKFLPVPNRSLSERQVEWETQHLSEWLQHLSGSALDQSCEKICTVLQQLNRERMEPGLHKQHLDEIAVYIKLFETRIDSLYLESAMMLPEYQQHCVEWLVWSFICLAEGYHRAADSIAGKEEKTACLYRGLWALGRAYLHIAAVYCNPPDEFWLTCYRGYTAAARQGLLDIEVADENKRQVTINQLFKLLLVFNLCDLRQFRPREMRRVFHFLQQFSDQLTLYSGIEEGPGKGLFAVNLREDMPPLDVAKHPELLHEPGCLFFFPARLAKNIFQALQQERGQTGQLKALNKAVLMRMIKTLGQTQSRKFQRIKEERQFRGIIGFDNIRDFLHKETEKPAVKKAVPPRPGRPYQYDTSQFDIVAEGDEVVFQMGEHLRKKFGNDERINKILAASGGLSGPINVWDNKNHGKRATDIDINGFDVVNSSAKGYGIAINNRQAKVKVGDLFAIVEEDATAGMELAIIRHIRRLFGDQLYLGVELIGLAQEGVLMQGVGEQVKQTKAIFLPAIKALQQPDTLIYSSPEFNSGEFVNIKKGNQQIRCRLNKLLNSTSSFCQAELFYPKIEGAGAES